MGRLASRDASISKIRVAGLLASGRVLITAVNVIEAIGTEEPARRLGLLRLERELARDLVPLHVPNELLQEVTLAHSRGAPTARITLSEKQAGIYAALHRPEDLSEQERQEVYAWKKSLEDPIAEAHRLARPEFQALSNLPMSAAKLIKFFRDQDTLVLGTVAPIYKRLTGNDLDLPNMKRLFAEIPEWPLYLAGWAHGMYHRAIKDRCFGAGSNPGTVDLMCAVYLRFCDCFVTSDAQQRRALRVLNVLNPHQPRARILSYGELRKRLLLCGTAAV